MATSFRIAARVHRWSSSGRGRARISQRLVAMLAEEDQVVLEAVRKAASASASVQPNLATMLTPRVRGPQAPGLGAPRSARLQMLPSRMWCMSPVERLSSG